MVEIVCPQCGTETRLDEVRRHGDSFCPAPQGGRGEPCDYPLFYAVTPATLVPVGGEGGPDHRRRLPGLAGHTVLAVRPCPVCAEKNPADGVDCIRCGSPLDPVPEPPPPPEPEAPVLPPPPPPEPDSMLPAWLLVGGLLVFLSIVGFWVVSTF